MLTIGPSAGHSHIRSKCTLLIRTFNISLSHLHKNHRFLPFRKFVHVLDSSPDINQSCMIVAQAPVVVISDHTLSLRPAPSAKRIVINVMVNLANGSPTFL